MFLIIYHPTPIPSGNQNQPTRSTPIQNVMTDKDNDWNAMVYHMAGKNKQKQEKADCFKGMIVGFQKRM
jgi:hypothetical protein